MHKAAQVLPVPALYSRHKVDHVLGIAHDLVNPATLRDGVLPAFLRWLLLAACGLELGLYCYADGLAHHVRGDGNGHDSTGIGHAWLAYADYPAGVIVGAKQPRLLAPDENIRPGTDCE